MKKCKKEVSVTYFEKIKEVYIDEINVGDIVYLKFILPTNRGRGEGEMYGKITKITKCYFWILPYCDARFKVNHQFTSSIEFRNENQEKDAKKLSQERIRELWIASVEERIEIREFDCIQ